MRLQLRRRLLQPMSTQQTQKNKGETIDYANRNERNDERRKRIKEL